MNLEHSTLPSYLLRDFIWREQIEAIITHLDTHKVIVLHGMGGEGKTRLAVQTAYFVAEPAQLAAQLATQAALVMYGFPAECQKIMDDLHEKLARVDYVDMIQCAQNEQDEYTFWSVLSKSVLGVTPKGTADEIRDDFLRYLYGKSTLLVLDNGELINPQLLVKALSALAKAAYVIVTCRYPIAPFGGGINLPVTRTEPLKCDNYGVLQANEAVLIFARRVGLDLYSPLDNLTNEQQNERQEEIDEFVNGLLKEKEFVSEIASICNLCDCIPLAIVLAASRAAILSKKAMPVGSKTSLQHELISAVQASLNHLYTELSKLRTSNKVGDLKRSDEHDTRFDTLLECISESYDRLGFVGDKAIQQSLFRALSVFSGEWTLADMQTACESIGGEGALSAAHLALQEAHLVVRSRSGATNAFTFLQPIRELAESLCTDTDKSHVQPQHCALFLDRLVKGLEPSSNPPASLNTYKKDIDAAMLFAFRSLPGAFTNIANVIEQTLYTDSGYFADCLPFARTLLEILEKNGISEWSSDDDTQTGFQLLEDTKCVLPANLFHLQRGRMISKVVSNEASLTALFGTSDPDYKALHAIEESDDWLRETEATISFLAENLEQKTDGEKTSIYQLVACMYFITHDWWDAYLTDDATAGKVLEQWKSHAGENNKGQVYTLLEQFNKNYPLKSKRKGRERKKDEWQLVLKALEGLQKELKVAPSYSGLGSKADVQAQTNPPDTQAVPGQTAGKHNQPSQPAWFLTGIMERYAGEASFYLRREWKKHYDNSAKAFSQDNDSLFRFYRQWTYGDQAQRDAEGYVQAGDNKIFDACYETLRDECREFKECIDKTKSIDIDLLDLELLANVYGALGEIHARNRDMVSASLCYGGAVLLALAFMLIEQDKYGIVFYREHHTDRMDKRALFEPSFLMRMQERTSGCHLERRQARERAFTAWASCWRDDASSSGPLPQSVQSVDAMLLKPPKTKEEIEKLEAALKKSESKRQEIAAIILRTAARFSAASQEEWWPRDKEELILLQEIAAYLDETAIKSLLDEASESA